MCVLRLVEIADRRNVVNVRFTPHLVFSLSTTLALMVISVHSTLSYFSPASVVYSLSVAPLIREP
jgi:hypothetical protein